MGHLDDLTALALAEGRSDPRLAEHASRCRRCRELVAGIQRLLGALEGGRQPALPERLRRWAQAYARTQAVTRPRFSLLGLLSEGAPLAAAVRGSGPAAAMLYGDERYQLDLRLEPMAAGAARLHGQVVPLGAATTGHFTVTVVASDGTTTTTAVDEWGEFHVDHLQAATGLSLVLEAENERLVVPCLYPRDLGQDDDDEL